MKIQRYKHELPISYALGATLTFELIQCHPDWVERVYLSPSAEASQGLEKLTALCRSQGIAVETSEKAFHVLSPKGNCFVIGVFRKEAPPLAEGNHIVLVNPSDAGNLGTILRTAAGFGIGNVAIIRPGVDPYDPRTVRASMGALFHVNVEVFDRFEDYCGRFPNNTRYSFMLSAVAALPEAEATEPYTLVFGNEATGLPEGYADSCTPLIIRHSADIDSLNLPMAAGIAMYEFTKKTWNA